MGSKPLRGLPEGMVDLELGSIVLVDGIRVLLVGDVHRLDRLHDFLRSDDQPEQLSRRPGCFAKTDEVLVRRFDRLADLLPRLHHPDSGRLQPRDGLGDIGLDPEDDPGQLDGCQVLFRFPLANQSDVAHAGILELPDCGDLDVHACAVGIQEVVGTCGEVACRELARRGGGTQHEETRQEGAGLLSAK